MTTKPLGTTRKKEKKVTKSFLTTPQAEVAVSVSAAVEDLIYLCAFSHLAS